LAAASEESPDIYAIYPSTLTGTEGNMQRYP